MTDGAFREKKVKHPVYTSPLNIYEVHLGSWKKRGNGDFIDYKDLAKDLAAYVKDMGYTAIELLPVTEHPLDDSWGYQCTGYFAPTSRFGTPKDFMWFVNHMHKNGILVLLDWVPSTSARTLRASTNSTAPTAMSTAIPTSGSTPPGAPGSRLRPARGEELSLLLRPLLAGRVPHRRPAGGRGGLHAVPGLRPQGGAWTPNQYGGHENLEAIEFLRELNTMAFQTDPSVLMIAEESTAWPKVTHPVSDGGLGFNFKWNMAG